MPEQALKQVEPTEEQEWEAKLTQIASAADKAQWEIGDLVAEAEDKKWGETYSRAVAITDKPKKTLRNYVYVCRKFEKSRRRDESEHLRFGHFAAVAGLSQPDQEKHLNRAEKSRWSVDQLRLKVSELRSKDSTIDPMDRCIVMFPRNLTAAFTEKAGALDKPPGDQMKEVAKWFLGLGKEAVEA